MWYETLASFVANESVTSIRAFPLTFPFIVRFSFPPLPADAGDYAPVAGSASCTACEAGASTEGAEGQAQCTACPGGTYSGARSPSCSACAAGYYSLEPLPEPLGGGPGAGYVASSA